MCDEDCKKDTDENKQLKSEQKATFWYIILLPLGAVIGYMISKLICYLKG